MTNKNRALLEEYVKNGHTDYINRSLCYHSNMGCRCMTNEGGCRALVDTVFMDNAKSIYDCPFYKTEKQYKEECKKLKCTYYGKNR